MGYEEKICFIFFLLSFVFVWPCPIIKCWNANIICVLAIPSALLRQELLCKISSSFRILDRITLQLS